MRQEETVPQHSVRKLLMPPLLGGLAGLLVFLGLVICWQYYVSFERQIRNSHASSARLFEYAVKDHQATMGALLEVFAEDTRLHALLERGDAKSLARLYGNTYRALYNRNGISRLTFLDAQQRVVLRLHDPKRFGDALPRHIFTSAASMRYPVAALDMSEDGRLIMRMAIALFSPESGNLIGFVETAAKLEIILDAVMQESGMDLAFVVEKERLSPAYADQMLAAPDSDVSWVDLDETILVYSSLPLLDKNFAGILAEKSAGPENKKSLSFVAYRGKQYALTVLPLTDSLGVRTGSLVIIEEVDLLWKGLVTKALILLAASLGAILIYRFFALRHIRKADRYIAETLEQAHEGDLILSNVFEESETGFVLQNWTTGEVLKANRVALAIFNVYSPNDIDPAQLVPLPLDHNLQRGWQSSDSGKPLMTITNASGETYCETDQFFIGSREEVQCLAIRDVTRIVHLQNENNLQIAYLQTIIDQLPALVFVKDADLRLTLYNDAFEKAVGGNDNMLGKIFFVPWIGIDSETLSEDDRKVLNTGVPYSFEASLLQEDGAEHSYVVSKRVIHGQNGEPFLLCVGTDISDRTRMERQLINLREKADAANMAKSQFLARMSHEIRTPMNVILGMSHLALNVGLEPRQHNYVAKIHSAAKNLLGIINDILDFSKIEAGEMHLETIPFSLAELLHEIQTNSQTLIMDKPVQFVLSSSDYKGEFIGDPLRIRQVLLNLVNNAIKFTQEGRVTLLCKVLEERAEDCDLYFAVEDTGIGIPAAAMARLFTSFQQVDGSTTRKYGGTGLGLAISQQFVNLMGGRILVQSREGSGSTFFFTISLPKAFSSTGERLPEAADWKDYDAPQFEEAVGGHEEEAADTLPEGAKILVVEDNDINQEIIVELLQNYGLDVTAVNNGLEAVEAVQAQRYALVLMDLQMPVMDGIAATRAIRSLPDGQGDEVPVIALTANAMSEDRERCHEAGMDDFLSKPIDVRELHAKLAQWLSK